MKEYINFKRDISTIEPSVIFDIYGYPIANSTLSIVFIIFLLLLLSYFAFRRKTEVPNKVQTFFEIIYESVGNQIKTITGSDYHTQRVFPIIASVFIFVGISNYLGIVPGLSSITWKGMSIFRTATSDFNTTFGLAFGAILSIHLVTINDLGLWGYIKKFIPIVQLREDLKKGVLSPIYLFVTILMACLDIIGEFAKMLSPSLRLFGNMYAGDVLTTVLIGIVAFVVPAFWVAFGLLGALIQTIVFGSLITLFYMQGAGPEKVSSEKGV